MDRRIICEAIRAARTKSFKIMVIFTDEAAAARVGKLLQIERRGIVEVDPGTLARLTAVSQTHNWPDDSHRVAVLSLTDEFDDAAFIQEIGPGLHHIEAVA